MRGMRPGRRAPGRRETLVVGAAGLGIAAAWASTAEAATPAIALLALGFVRSGAALLALSTAERLRADPVGRAWRFLGVGWLLAAVASVLTSVVWAFDGRWPPVPSFPNLFLLAGSTSMLWGLASYGAGPQERFGRLRHWLDIVIIVVAILGLVAQVLLQPVLAAGIASTTQAFWGLLWPSLDLVLITLALRLILIVRPGSERWSVVLLGVSGTVGLAADVITGYATLTGEAPVLRTPVSLWAAGAFLAALAAFLAARAASATSAEDKPSVATSQPGALLPVAMTYAVVGFTAVDAWLQGTVDPFGLGISIALTVLLFARQGVIAGQSEMRQVAALVEGAADMAFLCRPDGTISFANPSFAAALRRPVDSVAGIPLATVLAPDTDVAGLLAGGARNGWQGEVMLVRGDGSKFPARLSLRPVVVERSNRPVLAATAVDLSLIKEREALLRSALDDVAAARVELMALNRDLEAKVDDRTRELQRTVDDLDRLNRELLALDRLKSEFVTLVSHELRAPLTSIRAGLELMMADEAGIAGTARESLRLILEETERLGRFVEAILDLSALEAGRFPLRVAPLDLGLVVREAVARFRGVSGSERISIRLGVLPPVLADDRAMASVLYHLIDNALKYAPRGDIVLSSSAETERVSLAVADRGPGIPEAERERVFDMFHRLDSSDAREVYGHGLGLHLVRRLLEAMGGGIRVEGDPEGGARFELWLPRADRSPLEPAAAERRPEGG